MSRPCNSWDRLFLQYKTLQSLLCSKQSNSACKTQLTSRRTRRYSDRPKIVSPKRQDPVSSCILRFIQGWSRDVGASNDIRVPLLCISTDILEIRVLSNQWSPINMLEILR